MALTASISLSQTPISFNQKSSAAVTVSNSGLSDVTLLEMQPIIAASGGLASEKSGNGQGSSIPQGFGQVFTVPASGSVVVPMEYVVWSPQRSGALSQSIPATYSIGCVCRTSDGSTFAPSPATLTISPLS